MKRNVTDVLRRGLLSTLANWPVIVTRIVETVVAFGIIIVAIIALVVPVVVSAGLSRWSVPEGNPTAAVWTMLAEHALLFAYLFLLTLAVAVVLLAIHSFVTAGAARVFVDADRAAPESAEPRREQFAVFSMERWTAGARAAWLRIFWIYNGTLGMFGLILIIPLLLILIVTVAAAAAENVAATVGVACVGVALVTVIGIPLGVVIGIWAEKAVIVCVARDVPARQALGDGWREVRADFLRHFAVFIIIAAVSFGAAALLSAFAPLSFGMSRDHLFSMFFAPFQITLGIARNAVSNAIGCWLVAGFAAMTGDR